MWSWRGSRPAARVAVVAAAVAAVVAQSDVVTRAQTSGPLEVVPRIALHGLAGEWFEVAGTGAWSRRRCVADTRFVFLPRRDPRSLDVASVCTTSQGIERKRGRLRGDALGSGALRLRLVPTVFGVLPAVWSDFWVLALGEEEAWMLVGERHRRTLSVFSRTVALDETAFARALAVSRSLGYDVGRLSRVAHPAGATGLRP
jgi:lipocalin